MRWLRILPATRLRAKRRQKPILLRQPKLRPPEQSILRIQPGRDAIEPAAAGEVADRLFGLAQLLYGLRRDLDVAKQVHLADLVDADLLDHLRRAVLDLEHAAALAHAEAVRVEVERLEVLPRRDQQAGLALGRLLRRRGEQTELKALGRTAGVGGGDEVNVWGEQTELKALGRTGCFELARLIRQADADERAAGALGRVGQRRRDAFRRRRLPCAGDGALGFGERLVVERDPHTLPRLLIEDYALVAGIAVGAEHESLDAELDAVGRPRLGSIVALGRAAVFVVDGYGATA